MTLGRDGIGGYGVKPPKPEPTGIGLGQATLGALGTLNATMRELLHAVKALPTAPPGDGVKIQQLYGGTGTITDYEKPREFDVTSARVDEPITMNGDQLLAVTTADSLDTVGVKLNRQDAPIIYFNDSNPIYGHFDKVFLSHDAFSGGGTLKLLNSRGRIYSPAITSTPPKLATNQKKFSVSITCTFATGNPVAPHTATAVAAYTVPAGWRLFIGGALFGCNVSCLQKIAVFTATAPIGVLMFDMTGALTMSPISSYLVTEGETIYCYLYNNDTEYRDMVGGVIGVLEALEV